MGTIYYGRYNTGADPDFGIIGSGGQRSAVFGPLSKPVIIYRLGARIGKYSGSPRARLFIGNPLQGASPGLLIAYTPEFYPAASMTDGGSGAVVELDLEREVVEVVGLLEEKAWAFPAGYTMTLGITARDGTIAHGMTTVVPPRLNKNFYDKTGLSSTVPTNPIGGQPSPQGHPTVWAVGVENEPPGKPTNLSPSGALSTVDVTPNFAADFSDPNRALPNGLVWDMCVNAHIQVVETSPVLALRWDHVFSVNTASTMPEDAVMRPSVDYAGPTLSAGKQYYFRFRHMDRIGAWSEWSDYAAFTFNAGGSVIAGSLGTMTPSGKQGTQTPGPFTAKWTHPDLLSTSHVKLILYRTNATGQVMGVHAETDWIANVTPHEGTISIPWASTGFDDLPLGGYFSYNIRARDSGGLETEYLDAEREKFHINAAPNRPAGMSPAVSALLTTAPQLRARITDPDDLASALTAYFKLLSRPENINRDFDYDRAGWQGVIGTTMTGVTTTMSWDATVNDTVEVPLSGSLKLVINTNSSGLAGEIATDADDTVTCVAGESYQIAARLRTSHLGIIPRMEIVWLNASNVQIGSVQAPATAAPAINTFFTSIAVGVAPVGAVSYRTRLNIILPASTVGTVWLDNLDYPISTRAILTGAHIGNNIFARQLVKGTNEIQGISFSGSFTGGNYRLTVFDQYGNSQQTANIPYNASAATVQAALEALPRVGRGSIRAFGGPGPAAAIGFEFRERLQAFPIPLMTAQNINLTGTAPAVVPYAHIEGARGDLNDLNGVYQWLAWGEDGMAVGPESPVAAFTFGEGPEVDILSPTEAEVIPSSTFRITYDALDQVRRRIVIQERTGDPYVPGPIVYQTGNSATVWETTSSLYFDVPANILRNTREYNLYIYAENSAGQQGQSAARQFSVAYAPPSPVVMFTASPATLGYGESGDSVIRLEWLPDPNPTNGFLGYDIYRTPLGPVAGARFDRSLLDGVRVHLRRITNPLQVSYVDGNPASGIEYQYDILVARLKDQDEVGSATLSARAAVLLQDVYLSAATDPETFRCELRYRANPSEYMTHRLVDLKSRHIPVHGSKARTIRADYQGWDDQGSFLIVAKPGSTLDEQIALVRNTVTYPQTLCLRDFTGLRRFVTISGYSEAEYGQRYIISLGFNEEGFVEGEKPLSDRDHIA